MKHEGTRILRISDRSRHQKKWKRCCPSVTLHHYPPRKARTCDELFSIRENDPSRFHFSVRKMRTVKSGVWKGVGAFFNLISTYAKYYNTTDHEPWRVCDEQAPRKRRIVLRNIHKKYVHSKFVRGRDTNFNCPFVQSETIQFSSHTDLQNQVNPHQCKCEQNFSHKRVSIFPPETQEFHIVNSRARHLNFRPQQKIIFFSQTKKMWRSELP